MNQTLIQYSEYLISNLHFNLIKIFILKLINLKSLIYILNVLNYLKMI